MTANFNVLPPPVVTCAARWVNDRRVQLIDDPAQDGPASAAIVDAALDLIVEHGLSGLTLRPLAQRVGVSVAAISTRMGSKDQLIDRVTDAAAARDATFFAQWRALASDATLIAPAARAALSDLAFRDWLGAGRGRAILLIELVQERALHAHPSLALDGWLRAIGNFWSSMIFGTPDLHQLALGYVLDEAGFAIGAGDDPTYAALRILCLQRFAAGLFPRADQPGVGETIARLIAALEPRDPPVADPDDPKRQRIASSVAQIIVSQGIEAVTHRSVALAAGIPASTVVYHFGARPALVVAGLHAVIARFHVARDRAREAATNANDDADARDLVKATSMIALASAREPSLLRYALDMRRRRGENIRQVDMPAFGIAGTAGFDRATAQVLSIALFGMRMVAMARQVPEREHYQDAFAALDAWRATAKG